MLCNAFGENAFKHVVLSEIDNYHVRLIEFEIVFQSQSFASFMKKNVPVLYTLKLLINKRVPVRTVRGFLISAFFHCYNFQFCIK